MPKCGKSCGETTRTSIPRARTASTESATKPPAASPGWRGYEVVRTSSLTYPAPPSPCDNLSQAGRSGAHAVQAAREHERRRQDESREDVEVVELHRQVKGVRDH